MDEGISPADLDDAREELVGLGKPTYTALELAEMTGISVEDAKRIWRALGFVVRPVDEVFFNEQDLGVLQTMADFIRAGIADLDTIVSMTRTFSQSVARIAEAEAEVMRDRVRMEGAAISPEEAAQILPVLVPALELFLTHAWRRHLEAALSRVQVFETSAADEVRVIGFADLVGFTRLSLEVDGAELSRIVEELEARAQDIISTHGGRVVKMIGDEVMFAAADPTVAATMALELTSLEIADSPLRLRGGLAYGPVISQRGDFFGPVVNLARRAASAARSQSILVTDEVRKELADTPDFYFKEIPTRRLKGIGPTRLWALRPSTAESSE
jgi:adenylate cyclase